MGVEGRNWCLEVLKLKELTLVDGGGRERERERVEEKKRERERRK